MSKKIIISFFDYTGIFVKPWSDNGYECHIIDIQHPQGKNKKNNITKIGMDVYEWEKCCENYNNVLFAAFFPPCTDLAVSGARWFKDKERKNPGTRKRAMDLVYWSNKIGKKLNCPYFIENPVSIISSEWKKPNYYFHPYEYGGYKDGNNDGYSKKTCLWTGGGFTLPEKKPIPLDVKTSKRIWLMPPGPERQNLRSQTPKGFSQAIFEKFSK